MPSHDSLPDEPVDLPGAVVQPTAAGLPEGYVYGVTRYADLILQHAFPMQFGHLIAALENFDPQLHELISGGGNKTPFVSRFDRFLADLGWGKRKIVITKLLDDEPVSRVRGHEIDMFAAGGSDSPYPGVAVEQEWSNKDPFFDRDLLNFQALHREGALAVGVIITRGPTLQTLIKLVVRNAKGEEKYGESTTHWNKLVPRVNLGGGGECPLLLIGIEPPRIGGIDAALAVQEQLRALDEELASWRGHGHASRQSAMADVKARRASLLQGLRDVAGRFGSGGQEE